MVALGLGSATSVRVANELGAGAPAAARRAFRVALGLVVVLQACLAGACWRAGGAVAAALSSSPGTQSLVVTAMPALAASFVGE